MKLLACLLLVFGLLAAAAGQPFGWPPRESKGLEELRYIDGGTTPIEEEAESQIEPISTTLLSTVALPLALKGAKHVALPLAKYVAKCALCDDGCSSFAALQSATDQRKEAAKLMALGYVMESIDKLKDLKQSMMKDDQVAEAEVFDWISSAIDGVGGIAKDIVCKK